MVAIVQNPSMHLLVVLVGRSSLASLVSGNLLLDPRPPLLPVELVLFSGQRLLLPLLSVLLGRLEDGVLSDGSVGRSVNLLDIVRSNVVGKVGRELLLESDISKVVDSCSPLVVFLLQ